MCIRDRATKYLEDSGHIFPEYQCKAMLTKLGIIDFEKKMDELSGGQRKRVAMEMCIRDRYVYNPPILGMYAAISAIVKALQRLSLIHIFQRSKD